MWVGVTLKKMLINCAFSSVVVLFILVTKLPCVPLVFCFTKPVKLTVGKSTTVTQQFSTCPFERVEKKLTVVLYLSFSLKERNTDFFLIPLSSLQTPLSLLAPPQSMFHLNAFCPWQLSELGIL